MSPDHGDDYYQERNASRSYKGGALNTNDPIRVRVSQAFHSPSPEWRRNLGFRCYRTVCIPRLDQG